MSHTKQGILVKLKGNVTYDSRNIRPQIAVGRDPKHLDILNIPPGTAIVTSAGNGFFAQEILLTIKHGLKYKPKVLVYFYIVSNGRYGIGKYLYGAGAADDSISYRVDSEKLEIIHTLDDTSLHTGLTSTAPSFIGIRIKYLIFSNPIDALTGV